MGILVVMLETLQTIVTTIADPSSIWSVVARAVIWFILALIIIVSVDSPRTQNIHRSVRRNLGMFLLCVSVGGGLLYLLFSFTSVPA